MALLSRLCSCCSLNIFLLLQFLFPTYVPRNRATPGAQSARIRAARSALARRDALPKTTLCVSWSPFKSGKPLFTYDLMLSRSLSSRHVMTAHCITYVRVACNGHSRPCHQCPSPRSLRSSGADEVFDLEKETLVCVTYYAKSQGYSGKPDVTAREDNGITKQGKL